MKNMRTCNYRPLDLLEQQLETHSLMEHNPGNPRHKPALSDSSKESGKLIDKYALVVHRNFTVKHAKFVI